MRRDFTLPDLGEGLTDGEVVKWLVQPGDHVTLNQPIVEVETAKAAVELPSPYTGVIAELHAAEGATVDVGATLVSFDVEPAAAAGGGAPPAGEDEYRASVAGGRPPGRGRRRRLAAVAQTPATPARAPGVPAPAAPAAAPGTAVPRATPPVRKYAQERGIDLAQVTGTGKDGRVTREDVEQAVAALAAATPAAAPAQTAAAVAPDQGEAAARPSALAGHRADVRETPSATRRAIARQMVASASTIPHVTEFLTVDATELLALRDRLRALPEAAEVRITPLAVVAKAVCVAVRGHPRMNSSWDDATDEIVLKPVVNLGVATDTEAGLLVPNVKDAGALGIIDLAREITRLTELARARTAAPAELTGGTITITNVGGFGVEAGTPIINKPECAIVATGAIARRPWVIGGVAGDVLAVRSTMTLSVSFDHRIVDGAYAARFLNKLGTLLEQPSLLAAF